MDTTKSAPAAPGRTNSKPILLGFTCTVFSNAQHHSRVGTHGSEYYPRSWLNLLARRSEAVLGGASVSTLSLRPQRWKAASKDFVNSRPSSLVGTATLPASRSINPSIATSIVSESLTSA